MPEGILQSNITPIFKGGDHNLPSNYRPIALTNHTTKVFERVLWKALVFHLEINHLMNPSQHGFRSRRSTISQILRYYDSVLTHLEEGHDIDVVYFR